MIKTLAIFSPSQNAYSETFIQAHRKLPFNIKYYYDGYLPTKLEGQSSLAHTSLTEKISNRFVSKFSMRERWLMRSLKNQQVDCVLAEYGPTACTVLPILIQLKIPLVVHFHGYDASEESTLNVYAEKYSAVFEYASAIIVVSNKMKQAILNLGCTENKITVNCCAPEVFFLEILPGYNSSSFISVGRFVDKKAPYITLAAFKKVVTEIPSAKLIMVGNGPLLNTCKNLAAIWGIADAVDFKGVQSSGEISLLLKQSIAFVQHSIVADSGDSEGTPVSILEAQAAGLPVIATFHGGIPDVVTDGETGLLVNELDVAGMADKMLRIVREGGLAQKLGKAGKERIRANFTMKQQLSVLNKVMNTAIFRKEKYKND